MKLETATKLVEKANQLDIGASLYEGYSGRGMFGRQTTGVVVEAQEDIIELMIEVACGLDNEDKQKFLKEIKGQKWDNLGKQYICY